MRRKLVVLAAALLVGLAAPTQSALAKDCEDICGEMAAKNCENIDSMKCAFYIWGCLSGCSVGQILDLLDGDDGGPQ